MNKETSILNHENAFNKKAFGLNQLCDALRNLAPFVKYKNEKNTRGEALLLDSTCLQLF